MKLKNGDSPNGAREFSAPTLPEGTKLTESDTRRGTEESGVTVQPLAQQIEMWPVERLVPYARKAPMHHLSGHDGLYGGDDAFGDSGAEPTAAERESFPKLVGHRVVEGAGDFVPHEKAKPHPRE